jgi:hypothetical protein
MEGYLNIITKSSFLPTVSVKPVWAVLDGQTLSLYRQLDVEHQLPTDILKNINLQNTKVSKISIAKHTFCLSISYKDNKTKLFDCSDNATCSLWFAAFNRAINLQNDREKMRQLPIQYRKKLGFPQDPSIKLSKSDISKAYKKLCLKEHPDKGMKLIPVAHRIVVVIIRSKHMIQSSHSHVLLQEAMWITSMTYMLPTTT